MILDSKLDFQSNVREAIVEARRGIGLIRYLPRYVSREVLDVIHKLYVRPYLDYGDIFYHKYDPEMRLTFTQKLEQTQYRAPRAVTGTWRGTNRQTLFNELGWKHCMIEGSIVDCVIYSPLLNPNHPNTCIVNFPQCDKCSKA